jgi:hypothetical protein
MSAGTSTVFASNALADEPHVRGGSGSDEAGGERSREEAHATEPTGAREDGQGHVTARPES